MKVKNQNVMSFMLNVLIQNYLNVNCIIKHNKLAVQEELKADVDIIVKNVQVAVVIVLFLQKMIAAMK